MQVPTAHPLLFWIVNACLLITAHAGPGAKMYDEFEENGQLYPDAVWQEYVQELGQKLLAVSSHAGKTYQFFVLDNSQINAFATPDAYIFVNRGLIAFLGSEEELAAVVGHEIGHVLARHSRKRRLGEIFGKSSGLVAAVLTGRGELYDLSNAATATVVSGYGRDMELEADRIGGELLARAGYNPLAIIDVVQVLKDQELFSKQVANRPSNYHGLFASHPKNDRRLYDAVAYAQNLLPEEVSEPMRDFWQLIDGLTFGDEAVAGIAKGNIYYHGGLRVVVEFPENWQITNSQNSVSAQSSAGKSFGSITMARHEPVKRKSPEKYVTDVLQRDDVKAGESLEINGFEAYVGELEVLDTSKTSIALIGVIYRGKHVLYFKGEAGPKGDAEAFREDFKKTLAGLRNFTANDTKIANSRRIDVLVAEPGLTYAELANQSSLTRYPEETLRLLNGGYPNGEPRAGDFVKVIK